MQPLSNHRTATFAVAMLVMLSGVGAVSGAYVTQEGPPEPTTENRPPSDGANFTVQPDDHSPGTQTAYTMLSKGEGPWGNSQGLQTVDSYKITTQGTQFQDCTPDNARAFGIDRKNDAPGTQTDKSLLQHMKDYSVSGRVISVNLYEEGDLGGSPTYLNRSDETVARLAGCVVTPQEPGWYQFTGYVNGTNYQGNYQEVTLYSNYFYVCDCENREQAKQKLGPPPHSGEGQSGGSNQSTDTATPDSDGSTPTSDDGSNTTTATDGNNGGNDGGAPDQQPTDANQTATAGNDTATGNETMTGNETATTDGNASTDATADGDAPDDQQATPTTDGGPGFGLAAALVALALVGLLARRY